MRHSRVTAQPRKSTIQFAAETVYRGWMNRLFLLRHAKAAWAAPGTSDFDRPLDETGLADAPRLGAALAGLGLRPGRVICSSAVRTVQTWAEMAPLNDGSIETVHDQRVYSADAPELLDIVREQDFEGDLMIVGHNPTIEDTAEAFSEEGTRTARDWLATGFPTCGFGVIELDTSFNRIQPGRGRLVLALGPADI